jgi:photosystem I reaction center subunit XII
MLFIICLPYLGYLKIHLPELGIYEMLKIKHIISTINIKRRRQYNMISDSSIFIALGIALVAAIMAIGLGRQLYI